MLGAGIPYKRTLSQRSLSQAGESVTDLCCGMAAPTWGGFKQGPSKLVNSKMMAPPAELALLAAAPVWVHVKKGFSASRSGPAKGLVIKAEIGIM